MSTITVYTKPACQQCSAVFRALDKKGIDYRGVDISADSETRDYVMALGYLQAPVVYSAPTTTFPDSGPTSSATRGRPRRLNHDYRHLEEPAVHQLTIDHNRKSVSVSDHPDFGDAHRALLQYVVGADYYLRPVQNTPAHTSYELLRLADIDDPAAGRHPHVTGVAVIEQLTENQLPVSAPYFAACEAQRWISDNADKWLNGATADPGYHYPMTVLTVAHAEAHRQLRAGTVLPEAARLADAGDVVQPDPGAVETLRDNAISTGPDTHGPAAVATAVQQMLPAGVTDQQTAALVWYYALILWGVSTP